MACIIGTKSKNDTNQLKQKITMFHSIKNGRGPRARQTEKMRGAKKDDRFIIRGSIY